MSGDEFSSFPVLAESIVDRSDDSQGQYHHVQRIFGSKVFRIEEQTPERVFGEVQAVVEMATSNGLKIDHMRILQNLLDAGCDPEKSGELIHRYMRVRAVFIFGKAEALMTMIVSEEEDHPEFLGLIGEASDFGYDPYKCQELIEVYMKLIALVRYEKAERAVFSMMRDPTLKIDCKKLIQDSFEAGYDATSCKQLLDRYNQIL